jgi:hypothetical protein
MFSLKTMFMKEKLSRRILFQKHKKHNCNIFYCKRVINEIVCAKHSKYYFLKAHK